LQCHRYSLSQPLLFEHLLTLPVATKLLLLIAEANDTSVLKNRGYPAHRVQNLPTWNISGRTYLQLKCTLSDVHMNEQATKRSLKYKETSFEADVTGGRSGFKFKFDGFEKDTHVTWREVLNNPSAFMFFGTPVAMSQSYGLIFKNAETFQAVHHCFINYCNHFEGGVKASLCLLNSYLAACASVLKKKLKKASCPTTTKKGKTKERCLVARIF